MNELDHILTHLGEARQDYQNAVAPPIFQTTNFCFDTVDEMRQRLKAEADAPFYTRGYNPTVATLRKKLAALEGTEEAMVFASGSAAIAAGVMSAVGAGDHIVCVAKPYSWTSKLLTQLLPRFGVTTTLVDGRDPENFRRAIQENTRLFVLESPNSVTFEMQDVPAVAEIARAHKLETLIDNSFATPLNQRPADWGVDMVAHSASKYLNGHGDVVAGVLCCSREKYRQVFAGEFMTLGGVISPHDAWLMLRGLRTLPLRMDRVAETTPKVVNFLARHPKIEAVHYPFHPSFPQYDLARRSLKRPTGQFSIRLKAERPAEIDDFCNRLDSFLLACSWGGYESLIFPTTALLDSNNYGETPIAWNTIRFYVGHESAETLIADLEQALQ